MDKPAIVAEKVVAAFNELGYGASFAAVAAKLGVPPPSLYVRYPSREALGEAWLTGIIPNAVPGHSLHRAFTHLVFGELRALETFRDFGRAWVAATLVKGPQQMALVRNLHDALCGYLLDWTDANQAHICLPEGMMYEDVRTELADALALLVVALVGSWETDRTLDYGRTRRAVDSLGYLVDGLLMRREEFGHAGLLLHLFVVADVARMDFLQPLLDIFLKADRASKLLDPVNLLEFARSLQLGGPASP